MTNDWLNWELQNMALARRGLTSGLNRQEQAREADLRNKYLREQLAQMAQEAERDRQLKKELAEMNKPKWYDYLTGILGGAVSGFAGGLGSGFGASLMRPSVLPSPAPIPPTPAIPNYQLTPPAFGSSWGD